MKYFAKYIPVEGRLMVGGLYWNKQHKTADLVSSSLHLDVLHRGDFQPVKLFLCSRDNPEEPVGMINPKDTWVKEGDEFSEDEISRAFVGDRLKTGTVQIKCRCCGKYSPL